MPIMPGEGSVRVAPVQNAAGETAYVREGTTLPSGWTFPLLPDMVTMADLITTLGAISPKGFLLDATTGLFRRAVDTVASVVIRNPYAYEGAEQIPEGPPRDELIPYQGGPYEEPGATEIRRGIVPAVPGRLPISIVIAALPWLPTLFKRLGMVAGSVVGLGMLPPAVRKLIVQVAKIAGITYVVQELLLDFGENDIGLMPVPDLIQEVLTLGTFSSGLQPGDTIRVGSRAFVLASEWEANGVEFWRMVSGHIGTRNQHGVWKVWKPKRPTVIFPTGATDLKDFIRADHALDKQSTKIAKTLRRRGYDVKRS